MKTSRKIFRWIIVFAMFLTLMAPVFAATDYGITWEISEDGVLTISANGELKQNPWVDDAEKVKKKAWKDNGDQDGSGGFTNGRL